MKEVVRSYGAVVYRSADTGRTREYLLVHHVGGGHWGHPKGHPELDEISSETAKREIGEECGISVQIHEGFFVEESWMLPDGQPKLAGYYLACASGDELERPPGIEKEILESRWFSYADARKTLTYEAGRRVLDKAERFISKAC